MNYDTKFGVNWMYNKEEEQAQLNMNALGNKTSIKYNQTLI